MPHANADSSAHPAAPSKPIWEIAVTRQVQSLRPQVDAWVNVLARRFHALGLSTDIHVKPTRRGWSTFLALIGRRGLIAIVDLTLVDGVAVGEGPRVTLDLRLLDACGDVVAAGLARGVCGHGTQLTPAAEALRPDHRDQALTTVYLAALAQFDLLRPRRMPI